MTSHASKKPKAATVGVRGKGAEVGKAAPLQPATTQAQEVDPLVARRREKLDAKNKRRRELKLNTRRRSYRRKLDDPTPNDGAEVVLCSELRPYIKAAIAQHNRDHPATFNNGNGFRPESVDRTQTTALDWMVAGTKISKRTIYAIMEGEREHVSFYRIADPLLAKLQVQDQIGVTIHVIKNPRWSDSRFERYLAAREKVAQEPIV